MLPRLAAIAVALVLAFLASSASASPTVSAVYFYPNDQTPTTTAFEANLIVADVQGWYGLQVSSTFDLSAAEVIQGQGDTQFYLDGGVWTPILRELGYYCGTGVHVIIVHPSIGFTGGGACNNLTDGGAAMIEEDVFSAQDWFNFNGVVAHELGHAFDLALSDCTSVMLCWWDYPDVGLTEAEVAVLQASVFFGAEPEPPCEPKFNKHGRAIGPKRCR